MMNSSFSAALSLQGRVLWALCLREIHGKHGKSKLGYLWQLIKTAFGIAVFWWIRTLGGFATPHGMPLPLFLLLGFIPWYIFDGCLRMVMEAVRTNKALLTFPQVFPLDLCISSAIVVWVTEIVIFAIYMALISLMGYNFKLHAPLTLYATLIGVVFFGLGSGLLMNALNLYFPALEKIVPMAMRILFFTSGVFFSPAQITGGFGDIIYLNPMVNFIELARGSFVTRTPGDEIKITYIIVLTVCLLAVGLLLERHVRPKQI